MKRLTTPLLSLIAIVACMQSVRAQVIPYSSQDGIERSRVAAADSFDTDAILVGIITAGEIDLSDIGIDVDVEGLNMSTGRSALWGYVYRNVDSTRFMMMVPIDWEAGGDTIVAFESDDFDVNTEELPLDLTGPYSDSDAMVGRITEQSIYQTFFEENPFATINEVTLEWYRSPRNGLPASFRRDTPIWLVTFRVENDFEKGMTCFVSTGTGETFCRLRPITGVDEPTVGSGALVAQPNIVTDDASIVVSMTTNGAPISSLTLHDQNGERIMDLTARSSATPSKGSDTWIVPTTGLPSGTYIIVARSDRSIRTTTVRIVR